jgi:RNA polymerase sigma-70 factor (ECF subfamily)
METEMQTAKLQQMLTDPGQREAGFRELMSRYGEALYWHIRRIVVSHDDAEDVLQETCIKIFKSIDTFRGEGKLTTWIYSIATREALTLLRSQTHLLQGIDDLGPSLASRLEAETPIDSQAVEVLFQKALLTLPTQQRIAFNLRYYDELSYEEIARITGKNVNTLKSNYHWATEKIKEYLKRYEI